MASPSQSVKENWLLRYLRVQDASDAHLTAALNASLDGVDAHLKAIEAKPGIGAAARRAQLLGNRGIITRALQDLYRRVGDITREGQANAAEQATAAEWTAAKRVYSTIIPDPDKRAILEKSLEQSARRNVQSMMTRILQTEQPLSRRIYVSEAYSKGLISRVVNVHLAKGSSAEELAKDVRDFFQPNTPGGVQYAARRLARSEINNAFHAQAMADMADRPWVNQCRWHLSGSHKVPDECNQYAETALFPADNIPKKPHPNCFCYITPELPDIQTVINDYLAGSYNSWIAENLDDGIRRSA